MRNKSGLAIVAALTGFAFASPPVAFAAEKIEGKVVGTKLTACDFENKRCEGYLTLESVASGKAESLNIRVKSDTSMTKGSEKVLLPALRGSVVSVSYVKEKGETLAKSIEVLQSKK